MSELQKALSESRMKLFEERQMLLKYRAENESLLERHGEDQRRVNELVGLANPV
jgi:hypothetical protein